MVSPDGLRVTAFPPPEYPLETQLALMRRDIEEIHTALHGDGRGRKGLVEEVRDLVLVVRRGQWSVRILFWCGGAFVTVVAAASNLKNAVSGIFFH